jgi:DNA uptake protein ComE-like DNA-binding protein
MIISDSEFDYSSYSEQALQLNNQYAKGTAKKTLFRFNPNTISVEELDSLDLPINVKRNMVSYRNAGGVYKTPRDFEKIYGMNDSIYHAVSGFLYFNFSKSQDEPTKFAESKAKEGYLDPNKAEFDELLEFGLTQFQAKNVLAYRNKGGIFKFPDEILKIYGIDSALYESIKNNIRIELSSTNITLPAATHNYIELNEADSSDLVELKGIGPSFANRIIKYRERLGGYYAPSQVLEVYNFPIETYTQIESQIYADSLKIRKIRINFVDFKELIRHPYFSKRNVDLILKFREKHGPFLNLADVKTAGVFNEAEFKKVLPYLTCR